MRKSIDEIFEDSKNISANCRQAEIFKQLVDNGYDLNSPLMQFMFPSICMSKRNEANLNFISAFFGLTPEKFTIHLAKYAFEAKQNIPCLMEIIITGYDNADMTEEYISLDGTHCNPPPKDVKKVWKIEMTSTGYVLDTEVFK